jgi:two-component system LytT family response regulator
MSIACYIVDDQQPGIDAVAAEIKKNPNLKLVDSDTDPYLALNKILLGIVKVDLLFVDMEMGDLSGRKFVEHLGDILPFIFVTGYEKFALEAFRLGAVDYLTKPVRSDEFTKAIKKAMEKLAGREKLAIIGQAERCIFLRFSPRNVLKQKLSEIAFIHVVDQYLEFHIGQAKPLILRKSLSDMESILPKDMFLRVHRSTIINVNFMESMVNNKINMAGGLVVDIGSNYMDAVYSHFDFV